MGRFIRFVLFLIYKFYDEYGLQQDIKYESAIISFLLLIFVNSLTFAGILLKDDLIPKTESDSTLSYYKSLEFVLF